MSGALSNLLTRVDVHSYFNVHTFANISSLHVRGHVVVDDSLAIKGNIMISDGVNSLLITPNRMFANTNLLMRVDSSGNVNRANVQELQVFQTATFQSNVILQRSGSLQYTPGVKSFTTHLFASPPDHNHGCVLKFNGSTNVSLMLPSSSTYPGLEYIILNDSLNSNLMLTTIHGSIFRVPLSGERTVFNTLEKGKGVRVFADSMNWIILLS